MQIIEFFKLNYGNIATVICVLIGVSSIIVRFTPNTKDNKILKVILNVLDKFAITQTAKNKKYIDLAKSMIEEDK